MFSIRNLLCVAMSALFVSACVDNQDPTPQTPKAVQAEVQDAVTSAFEAMKAKHGDEEAGIFVDKNGCQNYIADRGPELGGFVYALVDANGAPFCS